MKLPDLIYALERNEYAEVLRGSEYAGADCGYEITEPTFFTSEGRQATVLLLQDSLRNAATVTVLREAVRELRLQLGIASRRVKNLSAIAGGRDWEADNRDFLPSFEATLALTAPLVNENNNESVNA